MRAQEGGTASALREPMSWEAVGMAVAIGLPLLVGLWAAFWTSRR